MKTTILSLGVAALMAVSVAAEKKTAAKTEVECPVMKGHKVNVKEATGKKAFADHKGRRYFFCCAGCAPEFKKNPEKFAKAESLPTPKK